MPEQKATGGDPSIDPPERGGSSIECPDVPEQCAAFERVLSGVADRLANAANEQFGQTMTVCLREIVEFLDFDRATLMTFSRDGRALRVAHSWAAEGVRPMDMDAIVEEQLPWYTRQIRSGHIVRITSSQELPAEAAAERDYLLTNDMKSNLSIPLTVDETIVGVISFGVFRAERPWPTGIVMRLRLVGEVLAMGLVRHRQGERLEALATAMDQWGPERARWTARRADQLRRLVVHLTRAEYNEQRRLAESLHEDVTQVLSSVILLMRPAEGPDPAERSAALSHMADLLRLAVQKLRRLSMELHPHVLHSEGIVRALQWLAEQMREEHGLEVEVRADHAVEPMSDDLRVLFYEAARQLLGNVVAHARCQRAVLTLERVDPQYARLTVTDEGRGFDPARLQDIPSGSFGLFSIREQAALLGGSLDLRSAPGQGTYVAVTLPT